MHHVIVVGGAAFPCHGLLGVSHFLRIPLVFVWYHHCIVLWPMGFSVHHGIAGLSSYVVTVVHLCAVSRLFRLGRHAHFPNVRALGRRQHVPAQTDENKY